MHGGKLLTLSSSWGLEVVSPNSFNGFLIMFFFYFFFIFFFLSLLLCASVLKHGLSRDFVRFLN
jgi:hypothetical protein